MQIKTYLITIYLNEVFSKRMSLVKNTFYDEYPLGVVSSLCLIMSQVRIIKFRVLDEPPPSPKMIENRDY